jgi:hypothetical protein
LHFSRVRSIRASRLAPEWLLTYAGVILIIGVLINLVASFAQYSFSLTIPSMRDSQQGLGLSYTQVTLLVTVGAATKMGPLWPPAPWPSGTAAGP